LADIKQARIRNEANFVIASEAKQSSFFAKEESWIASSQGLLAMTVRMRVPEKNEMKVIGLAGWSGAGKTTLLTRIIPHFLAKGIRVSVIKHAHHNFDVDVPGKDSWVHRQSGAEEVLVSSGTRWALMHELRGAAEPRLPELLGKMSRVDLVVVEGFKSEPHRKIEVHRAANGKPLLFPGDAAIAGIAADVAVETALPLAHLDDIPAIAAMMERSAIPVEDVLARSSIET
jgi:molybdopterin-guanine dinucleotide biosynthesis adapter protein